MPEMSTEEFDVVVVGGGPGGSAAASFVAMRGHDVLLLEKETFPRYQIGESLLPSTVLGVCRLLGVSDELREANFTVKRGGTFKWGENPEPWSMDFSVLGFDVDVPSYQVERMKFDDILLKNARRLGVDVRENCTVTETIGDSDRVRGVRYVDADGRERRALAKFVVDASGNGSRLYRDVAGSREYSEFFRNIALFGYFEGGKRLPAPNSGNILTAAFDGGWFWYIPLDSRLTSVGAVVSRDLADRVRGDQEEALLALIADCPIVQEYLADARRVTDGVYGKIRTRKDYSYWAPTFWRPGMVLVGDAACFIDPILSSGVHLATYSALLAARSINSVLAGAVDEPTAFREFESRYRLEYGNFYEFLVAFYDLHKDESSYFWKAKKIINHPASELEAFVTLVGGVSSGEEVLVAAKPGAGLPTQPGPGESEPTVPLPDWDVQQDIRIDSRNPLFALTHWVQDRAPEQDPGASGVVPSSDGLQWEFLAPRAGAADADADALESVESPR